jgi:hypothetical protein
MLTPWAVVSPGTVVAAECAGAFEDLEPHAERVTATSTVTIANASLYLRSAQRLIAVLL